MKMQNPKVMTIEYENSRRPNVNGKWLPDYRAMHFSAKRGIAIACRLSVRLSVCL